MLPILTDNHPILLTPCSKVDNPEDYANFAKEMVRTMYSSGGVGLAANQVGLSKQIIVIHLREHYYIIMYNPEVIWESKKTSIDNEGCLSYPGKQAKVKRKYKVRVRYQDVTSDFNEIELVDFSARIFQHEYDHLLGKTMFDRKIQ